MSKHKTEEAHVYAMVPTEDKGTGPASGGQSGDLQGISDIAEASSESVQELLEEGQYAEAELVDAIENTPDADVSEVHTRQLPTDDVPEEYLERD